MSMKDLFDLRISIREEMKNRIQTEIPKMLRSLPQCITDTFGDTELWTSYDSSFANSANNWHRKQDFTYNYGHFELILFLSHGPLFVPIDPSDLFSRTKITDNVWRIEIKCNMDDGASYREGNGDKIVIKFIFSSKHNYYTILTLYRLTDSPWFTSYEDSKEHQELFVKLKLLFTDEVLDFWKSNFDRILYSE